MARHDQLPIHRAAYSLLDVITDLARNMPRDFKASIGSKLRDECVEIITLIFRANCSREKAPHIETLLERLQVAELLLRLSRDKRLISVKQYAQAADLTTSIGKQASGWRRGHFVNFDLTKIYRRVAA